MEVTVDLVSTGLTLYIHKIKKLKTFQKAQINFQTLVYMAVFLRCFYDEKNWRLVILHKMIIYFYSNSLKS